MNQCWIYGLVDEGSTLVQYVGATTCPAARLAEHKRNVRIRPRFSRWLKQRVDMLILEQCHVTVALEREAFWINECKKVNPDLLNRHARVNNSYWNKPRKAQVVPAMSEQTA